MSVSNVNYHCPKCQAINSALVPGIPCTHTLLARCCECDVLMLIELKADGSAIVRDHSHADIQAIRREESKADHFIVGFIVFAICAVAVIIISSIILCPTQ